MKPERKESEVTDSWARENKVEVVASSTETSSFKTVRANSSAKGARAVGREED